MGAIVKAPTPLPARLPALWLARWPAPVWWSVMLVLALASPNLSLAQSNQQALSVADSAKFAATFAQPDSAATGAHKHGMTDKRSFWVGTGLIVGFGLAAFLLYNVRSK